jgi:Flp pilus assembly protein TadG
LLVSESEGSALLEFAITLPLLVVFVVGIYDFSGAFNQKQKIEQAAQEGAILAASQSTVDLSSFPTPNLNPNSLQQVVTAVFNSLTYSGVLAQGACTPPGTGVPVSGLKWTYTIAGCSSLNSGDNLVITIDRGFVSGGVQPPVCTVVTVSYPYHWRFNSVIQLLIPGANYAAITSVQESATVHNQT